MAVFGPKVQFLKARSATCKSRSRPPPLSFLLILCVIVLHTHRYHPPKFHPNLNPHDGVLIFTHFARAAACCLLLAACCLLLAAAAAKPGNSTLDTKKGYKTKTGSTSLVTLALTLTLIRTLIYICGICHRSTMMYGSLLQLHHTGRPCLFSTHTGMSLKAQV